MGKILGIGFIVLLVLIAIAFFLTNGASVTVPDIASETNAENSQPLNLVREERREIPPPPVQVANTYELTGELPSLDQSDEALFKHLSLLLSNVKLGLLRDEQFIRKLVLQVDNAANGQLIYQHSPFNGPLTAMDVEEAGEGAFVNQQSYSRYNDYGDLAASVDPSLLVAFYRFYEPLLDDAYSELGYPEGTFRSTLIKAIDEALSTPVVDGEIKLEQPEANYVYADTNLESLNMVQKQLLRMGPENTQKIQSALLSFKARIQ